MSLVSPELAGGGFFSTVPPRKPRKHQYRGNTIYWCAVNSQTPCSMISHWKFSIDSRGNIHIGETANNVILGLIMGNMLVIQIKLKICCMGPLHYIQQKKKLENSISEFKNNYFLWLGITSLKNEVSN